MTSINTANIINDAAAGEPYAVAYIDGVNAANGERAALAWQTRDAVPAIFELFVPHASGRVESYAMRSADDMGAALDTARPWQRVEYGDMTTCYAYDDDGEQLEYAATASWLANALYVDLTHDDRTDGDIISLEGTTLDDAAGYAYIDDDASDGEIAAAARDLVTEAVRRGRLARDAAEFVASVIDRRGAWGTWREFPIAPAR